MRSSMFKLEAAQCARGSAKFAASALVALTALMASHAAEARDDRNRDPADKAQSSLHPMVIVVSTGQQNLKAYDINGKVVAEAPVSTGQSGHETPHGVFSVIGKEQMHHSNLYNDAPMPWMQRITWSGVALHAGQLPGYPASHGCIRLPYGFSRSIYALTRMGTRVIVARGAPAPRSYAHAALFTPLPSEAAVAARAAGLMANANTGGPDAVLSPAGLLGISPANASELKPTVRTREQAAAERAERIATARTKLQAAEAAKSALGEAARAANEELQTALANLRGEKDEASQIELARRKLLSEIATVESEIATLANAARKAADDETAVEAGAEREQALEERLASLRIQAENAAAVVEEQAQLVAAATASVDAAQTRRNTASAELRQAGLAVEQARGVLEAEQRADANRSRPISIFISRKTAKLYVRQGFDELFDAAIDIDQRELPVGTHVFTAVAETADTAALRWNVVTVQQGQAANERPRDKRSAKRASEAQAAPDAQTAAAASTPDRVLERLKVSPEIRQRIAEFIKPGSSLIVSDHPLSHETGRGTEFVVLTR